MATKRVCDFCGDAASGPAITVTGTPLDVCFSCATGCNGVTLAKAAEKAKELRGPATRELEEAIKRRG